MWTRFFSLALGTAILGVSFNNCSGGFRTQNPVGDVDSHSTQNQGTQETGQSLPSGAGSSVNPSPPLTTSSPPVVSGGQIACRAPRYYSYVLPPGQEKFLNCTPSNQDIFSITIPDSGYAIARASLVFRNNNSSDIYYWSAQVRVGKEVISYAQGDDVCPATATPVKRVLGYGQLEKGSSEVRVQGTQGSSPCSDGQISVFSGALLEVWVEDPRDECQKKDLNMISSYVTIGSRYNWKTSMETLLQLNIPSTTDRTKLLVLGAVEGSPDLNPNNSCGQEAASLVAQLAAAQYGIIDTQTGVIPASQGMGHLVLSPQSSVSYGPSVTSVSLLVGSNTGHPVFTNDCCGDGKLGFIKLP